MCHLPRVTPSVTLDTATPGLPCRLAELCELPRGETRLEHPIAVPIPALGSTQSSEDFGTLRLIFLPWG